MSLARNASWLALGQVITGATNIVFPAIIARVLIKEDVGFYRQIDLAANLIIPFMVLGVRQERDLLRATAAVESPRRDLRAPSTWC